MSGFRHEALMYDGPADFVARTLPIVEGAHAKGAAVLVLVAEPRLTALRAAAGVAAARTSTDPTFIDMADVGRNPGRIISVWDDFVRAHADEQVVGIGEPIWSGRSRDELIECQIHEELIDAAFVDADGIEIFCPYDAASLSTDVISEAGRAHGPSAAATERNPFWKPLRAAPEGADLQSFDGRGVRDLRGLIAGLAARVGLGTERTADLVLAVNEIVTNSVRHGGGAGTLRAWVDGDAVVCQVNDDGFLHDPLVGRRRPSPDALGGRGLWLANQLCDLVQVRNTVEGCVVRIRVEGCRVG